MLLDETPQRVLAVYAHPDDPEVACGGTIARWAANGAEVHLLICTRGDKGTSDPECDPDELAERRMAEVDEAASLMGVLAVENLGRGDGEVVNGLDLRSELVERIRRVRPDTVLAPDPTAVFFGSTYVNHVDHREVGFAVLDACAPAASSPLYFPETGAAHSVGRVLLSATLEPDTWVDVSAVLHQKVAALACHRSQVADPGQIEDLVRSRARAAGAGVALEAAEAFRLLELGGPVP